MRGMIPHSRPTLEHIETKVMGEMLKSGHLARGLFCETLESLFTGRILAAPSGTFRARAVQSGTLALQLGLWALKNLREKRGEGVDNLHVLTSTLACGALVQSIRTVGARPILCETRMDGNLDVDAILDQVSKETLAVLVPHLYGKPIDLRGLLETDVPVFEDCAQTLGVETPCGRVGTGGRLMMTSFYATKPICTGQGGMIATEDTDLMNEIRQLCRYDERTDSGLGFNADLSDWSAALAIPQVAHFNELLEKRKRIAEAYHEALSGLSGCLTLPTSPVKGSHAWYRYVVLTEEDSTPFIEELKKEGIEAKRPVFLPQHKIFNLPGEFPCAEEHWTRSLSLPIYPSLTDQERDQIVEAVRKIFGAG